VAHINFLLIVLLQTISIVDFGLIVNVIKNHNKRNNEGIIDVRVNCYREVVFSEQNTLYVLLLMHWAITVLDSPA